MQRQEPPKMLRVQGLILLLTIFGPAGADAVRPPPIQFTADCELPVYASDMLVCEDAELSALDRLLARRIEQRTETGTVPDSSDDLDWFRRSRLCSFDSDHRHCLLMAYCLRLSFLDRPEERTPPACSYPDTNYIAAASISASGFSRKALEKYLDREISVWGFVDPHNMFGDDAVKAILGDWWSGYGSDPSTWQFNLRAHETDRAGQSFTVSVHNDLLRDDLIRILLRDAQAGKSTRVYLKGRITTFEAPTNSSTLRGMSMRIQSTRDIHVEPPAPR